MSTIKQEILEIIRTEDETKTKKITQIDLTTHDVSNLKPEGAALRDVEKLSNASVLGLVGLLKNSVRQSPTRVSAPEPELEDLLKQLKVTLKN